MNKQQFFKKYKTKSFKKIKCTSCERETKTYIGAIRQELLGVYSMFNICEECFCNSTADQRLKVFDLVGLSDKYLHAKCSVCKLSTHTFLQLERRFWFPRAVCPECFSYFLQDKDERYFLLIDKKQTIKINQLEKILTKFSEELNREEKYEKGDFSKEIKENGLYPFIASQIRSELEDVQKIMGEEKIKTSIIDNKEMHDILKTFIDSKQDSKKENKQDE